MSNSSLVNYRRISPNKTVMTNKKVDTITIHCMAGQCSVETCGEIFANPARNASSNYGIGPDGRVGLYVEEKDRAWTSSSRSNDSRAITIEVASDMKAPYAVRQPAYDKLILLLVDICQRNNIKKLLWKNDKSLIGQVNKQNMTVHRWFSDTACPGEYLMKRMGDIAKAVNKKLGVKEELDASVDPLPKDPEPVDNKPSVPSGKKVDLKVKIIADELNVRKGPGTEYDVVSVVKKNKVCNIVEKYKTWGKLKSGKGWISLSKKYVEEVTDDEPEKKPASKPKYVVGKNYTLQTEVKVRKGAGTNYGYKKHEELTEDGQKHDKDKDGCLDKGTVVTCLAVKEVKGNTWIKCASGWLAAVYNGNVYIK